jgi:hypothetical protein
LVVVGARVVVEVVRAVVLGGVLLVVSSAVSADLTVELVDDAATDLDSFLELAEPADPAAAPITANTRSQRQTGNLRIRLRYHRPAFGAGVGL